MAVATYDTQQGATVTLATDSLTLRITSITVLRRSVPNIRLTYLATTTNHTWTAGELADWDEVTVTYQNSPGVAQPTLGTAQTITVTGPTASGAGTPESVAGTGYVRSDDPLPAFSSENEALQMKQFIFKFNGLTGPTRTPSS